VKAGFGGFEMKKKSLLTALTALMLVPLAACGQTMTSSSQAVSTSLSSNSSTSSYSWDSRNFTEPANQVTTTKLVTYAGPKLLTTSSKVNIAVNGQDLFVYETRVNHARLFSYAYSTDTNPVSIFDFEGKVHVDVTVNDATVESAIVRPLMYGIAAAVNNNVISFDLAYSGDYVVEYNNDANDAIHIFANSIETNPVDPNNVPANTIYIGPGVYDAGAISLQSGSSLYLAGGAYVFGQIRTEGLQNITIRGRGIIDGQIYDRLSANQFTLPIEIRTCQNVTIEGITILDPAGWAITLYKSSNVAVDDVKIITARANGDGISVQSCSDVTVTGGFVRTWDDSLVVKNVDRGTTSNITFDGVTVWTDLAQSMETGYETNGPTMDGITFKNILVLHDYHKASMSIHNCDDAVITNVKYQNITIEDAENLGDDPTSTEDDFFIDILIAYNAEWTKSGGARGSIKGVTYDNVKVLNMAPSLFARINGEATGSDVENVAFIDMNLAGTPVKSASDLKLATNDFANGLTYSYTDANCFGAVFTLPYKLALVDSNVALTSVDSPAQDAPVVPSFAWMQGQLSYAGVPASGSFVATATHGSGSLATTPVDDGSGADEASGHGASLVIDGDRSTSWKSLPWVGSANEFTGLTIEFGGVLQKVGQVRLLGPVNSPYSYDLDLQVWGRKMKSDGVTPSDKYVRILSSKTYSLSPQSGNAIDLIIPSDSYFGLQFRFFAETGFMAPSQIEVAELQFFAPSLTYNKPIVDGSANADVYTLSNLTDGVTEGTSYYESAALPAFFVVDLENIYALRVIVLCLPPSYLWDARTENIEILTSDDNATYAASSTSFKSTVPATDYLFDPASGNLNIVTLATPVNARFIKLVFTSNSATGGYGAQLSEIKAYQ
jgi:hypothetical protein